MQVSESYVAYSNADACRGSAAVSMWFRNSDQIRSRLSLVSFHLIVAGVAPPNVVQVGVPNTQSERTEKSRFDEKAVPRRGTLITKLASTASVQASSVLPCFGP